MHLLIRSQDTIRTVLKGPYRFNSSFPQSRDSLVGIGHLKNNERHGVWVFHPLDDNDKVIQIKYSKKNFIRKDFYKNGQRSFKGKYSYVRGQRWKWKWFDRNNQIAMSGKYLFGYKHGKWKYTIPDAIFVERYYYGYSKKARKNGDHKKILVYLMTGYDARKAMEEEFIENPITREYGISFLPIGYCSLAMDQYYEMVAHNLWVDIKQFIRFGGKYKKRKALENALGSE